MASSVAPAVSHWKIDPAHTLVEFAVKHMVIATVKGRFGGVSGEIRMDEEEIARSELDVAIEAASIDTRNDQRDAHLRSADFLDAATHPTLTFRSRRVEPGKDRHIRVIGDLTIRGTSIEVALDVELLGRNKSPYGQQVAAFHATTTVNRQDWGLKWNQALETGGFLVGDDVKITVDAEAILET